MSEPRYKQYLGDGVYVDFDGYAIILTTENGVRTTNEIFLEPDVYRALVNFVKQGIAPYTQPKDQPHE